jgi:hypothetical protein
LVGSGTEGKVWFYQNIGGAGNPNFRLVSTDFLGEAAHGVTPYYNLVYPSLSCAPFREQIPRYTYVMNNRGCDFHATHNNRNDADAQCVALGSACGGVMEENCDGNGPWRTCTSHAFSSSSSGSCVRITDVNAPHDPDCLMGVKDGGLLAYFSHDMNYAGNVIDPSMTLQLSDFLADSVDYIFDRTRTRRLRA